MSLDLTERQRRILARLVGEYIEQGEPISSAWLVEHSALGVSSATVRNVLARLEEQGLVRQPHTSAGRIPTDKGYRFFVDHLTEPGRLDAERHQRVGEFFAGSRGALEDLMRRTGHLLSDLTNYASLVVGSKPDVTTVRSVQIVGLSARHATVVVVLANGSVESESDASTARAAVPKVGRNDPCPCGSGKKYKQCHGKLA